MKDTTNFFPLHRPAPLRPGDRVAIISPASKINPEYVAGAAGVLRSEGYEVEVMPHATGACGSFSAAADMRIADIERALTDSSVKAVVCSRGGYGAVHLLEALDRLPAECFNKWLVGFSDITALHALWLRKGYASLHGPMTKYIAMQPMLSGVKRELDMLAGGTVEAEAPFSPFNRVGECAGPVVGGNLAVFGGLTGTPFDPFETIFTESNIAAGVAPRPILMIEDIAEPIYKVERILWQLRLRGVFGRIAGLIVGQFTEYHSSADHPDMQTMISRLLSTLPHADFPVAMDMPFGHIDNNQPILLGACASMTVSSSTTRISSFPD